MKLFDLKPKTKQKSGFPKQSAYKAVFYNEAGSYPCFSVQELYQDLFVPDNNGVALISFPNERHKEKSNESLFSFLLPKEIINKVTNSEKNVINTDYQEFLVKKNKGRKITTILCHIFFSEEINSEKMFVKQVQIHFTEILKSAVFSDDLEKYLENVGDKVIVPNNASNKKANSKFHSVLEKKDHNSISIIIANFFISAMIGLHPIQYDTHETESGSRRQKTYLLNHLGMEYIWTPDQISEEYIRLQEIQYYYDKGFYTEVYIKALHRLIDEKEKEKEEKNIDKTVHSEVYRLLGLCLLRHPESCDVSKLENEILVKAEQTLKLNHCCCWYPEDTVNTIDSVLKERKSDGVTCLLKAVSLDKANNKAHFILYEYYKGENDKEKSLKYLTTAFAQNYAKAIVEVAFLFLAEETKITGISYEEILAKTEHIINHESENELTDVGMCYYLRGRFSRKNGNESEAQKDFEIAARKGNERAMQELIRKERVLEREIFPSFSNQSKAKCCFANTLTGTNYQVISTFPNDEWALYAPVKTALNGIQFAHDINEFIKLQHIGKFEFCRPTILFLLMSDDKEKNLNDCLELLDNLFNTVIEIPDKQKWELIDNTYIYVNANYETASMLIDANMSQMGNDVYFKVHIADENRDSVHKLLCDAPLFLPALNGLKSESNTRVVLFGSSEMNYCFVKESIASAYLGAMHPIEITLLGENADVLGNRFNQECPGVSGCPNITCIRPKFIKCNIKETDFPKLISGQLQIAPHASKTANKEETNAEIAETLKDGNYFIVNYADDLENIRFAMELRTWLLRSRGNFDRTPFIAVRVSDKRNSYLTSHLTLTGQAAGNSYYNKYDLFPFGILARTYHYKNIIEDPVLNRIALQIHKFYYLDNDLDKNDEKKLKEALEECKRSAENDFYSYSYNADSSTSTAIGLCYRFFAAKCISASKEDYLDFGALKDQDLISRFSDQLNSESIEELAKIEQSRWNSFMLIRGWLPANEAQVNKYEEQSSGIAHKHILAKLHPFINEWDNLDDSNLVKLLAVFKLKANYNKKPQVTTRRSIEDTTRFFKTEDKVNEQTH